MPSTLSNLKLAPVQSFSKKIFGNILATLCMLMGSSRAFAYVKPSMGQFFTFGSVALSSNFLFAWLMAEEASYFNQQGLISYLVFPMVMLVAGLILARRHHNATLIFVPAILWLVADTLTMLLQSGVQWLSNQGWLPEWTFGVINIVFTLAFVWQSLALLWIFGKQLRWSWLERVLIMLGAFAILFMWQKNLQSQPIFMTHTQPPVLGETDFYAQPILLDEMLAQLQPQRNHMTDWYFLGIAGHGEQDVFRSEIEQTKDFFDEQLGTAGRSLVLVNNTNTWQRLPIASKTSIERAIHRLAKQMDANEDVLFLTLSSHGADGIVEMSNPPLELEPVDATWLRQTLDKSGIKWRVIVISACYSGSFIPTLQTPNTLIITASARNKSSFGCSNEANYTYFGQAFFGDSLPKFRHFLPAFEDAKKAIAKRERSMGFEPSEPQMVIGKDMAQRLPTFEKTLNTDVPVKSQSTINASTAIPIPTGQ